MVVEQMGLFSRKGKDNPKQEFTNSRDIHDSFSVYVNEAKVVGHFFGLNFEDLVPHIKVFSFLLESPSCVAFMVMLGDKIQLMQCVEIAPILLDIPCSEIIELKIIEDYESENLPPSSPDTDNGEVHHLRTPRLAMSLVTKDQNLILIAHAGQVEWVYSYLHAGIFHSARKESD
jgi:hypothetical protein